jgi:N-acyl-D-aspartate/D-glutamate deacylase
MFDLVISGGRIVDGAARAAFKSDVGIKGDRIAAEGDLADAAADRRLDVKGLVVAPRFIDLHTHSDCTLLINGAAESQVHQGVTLENRATLEKPAQYPRGIEYVLVNGKTVIEKGDRTANNPGSVIRRAG